MTAPYTMRGQVIPVWTPGGRVTCGGSRIEDIVTTSVRIPDVGETAVVVAEARPGGPWLVTDIEPVSSAPAIAGYFAADACATYWLDAWGRWLDPSIPTIHWHQSFVALEGAASDPYGDAISTLNRWEAAASGAPPSPIDPGPPLAIANMIAWPNTTDFSFYDDDPDAYPQFGVMAMPCDIYWVLALVRHVTVAQASSGTGGGWCQDNAPDPVNFGVPEDYLYLCSAGASAAGNHPSGSYGFSRIRSVRIALNSSKMWNDADNPITSPATYGILLHEFGHALGLNGRGCPPGTALHDEHAQTVMREKMTPEESWDWSSKPLTDDDTRRIQELYPREVPSSTPKANCP